MPRKVSELNKSFVKKLGGAVDSGASRKQQGVSSALEDYKNKMENGSVLKLEFTAFGQEGLSLLDESGVLVILPSGVEETGSTQRRFTPMRSSLDYTIEVTVSKVDEEEEIVYVQAVASKGLSASSIVRNELSRELSAGRTPLVYGKVGHISPDGNRAIVNLYGMSIVGFINVRHWTKAYTRNLHSVCQVGDFYPFEVVGYAPKEPGKEMAFILNRANIAEDPWKNPTLKHLREGDSIMVKCVEIPAGKSYWWGSSPRVPDIEIMGDFTSRFPKEVGI